MASEVLDNLIAHLERLPGVGRRSAERIVFHLLRTDREEVFALAESIRDLKLKLKHCSICFNLTDIDPCQICQDPKRDHAVVCVVEQPKDLAAVENTDTFHGVYHVLMGRVAPLEGVETSDLTLDALVKRIEDGQVREIIMATNATIEGDGTALHVASRLKDLPVQVTRLARGLAVGGQLEFTSKATLADALDERRKI